ncbi:MAG: ATPase [Bacteroidales bacterium]|nr:ATPase [Bacteroidales bacterium]
MKLIADSGSTKTVWTCIDEGRKDFVVDSIGINPVRDAREDIERVIANVAVALANCAVMHPLPGKEMPGPTAGTSVTPSHSSASSPSSSSSLSGENEVSSSSLSGEDEVSSSSLSGEDEVSSSSLSDPDNVFSSSLSEVCFYGAGCVAPYSATVAGVLQRYFPHAVISVESDLLGAARALCGNREGIACILGTGSNSCLYDGKRIVANVSPLGWILGDEGSGAVLGKSLVGDLLKGQLPGLLYEQFLERFNLAPSDIIDRVYRQPKANRFLASFVPFIAEHIEDDGMKDWLIPHFRAFFRRNVAAYQRSDLSVHFVGGVASQFEEEVRQAAKMEGFSVGVIEKNPIARMVAFHRE